MAFFLKFGPKLQKNILQTYLSLNSTVVPRIHQKSKFFLNSRNLTHLSVKVILHMSL